MTTPEVLTNGTEKYTIIGTIDELTYGRILYARNENDEDVAIKIFHKPKLYSYRSGRQAIVIEQRLARKITDTGKPFLVQLLSSWDDRDNVYFVMRLYHESLLDRIQYEQLSPDELELCIAEMVSALASLHAADIMHRDIKAENIFIAPSGHFALGDFGLAYNSPSDDGPFRSRRMAQITPVPDPDPDFAIESNAVVGTPGYMAPEVVTLTPETTYSKPADVWSLGMTLLEVAIGIQSPYYFAQRMDQLQRLMMTHDPPVEWVEDLQLRDLFSKMLHRSPYRRWTAERLKGHPFFSGIDWEKLEQGGYCPSKQPPFVEYDSRCATAIFAPETPSTRRRRSSYNEHLEFQLRLDERDEEKIFRYQCPDHLVLTMDQFHRRVDFPADTEEEADDSASDGTLAEQEHDGATEAIVEVKGEETEVPDPLVVGLNKIELEESPISVSEDTVEASDVC